MYWFYNNAFFFPYVGNILDSKNAPIYDISIFFLRKVNLVGSFGKSKLKVPSNFRKLQEKPKKWKYT